MRMHQRQCTIIGPRLSDFSIMPSVEKLVLAGSSVSSVIPAANGHKRPTMAPELRRNTRYHPRGSSRQMHEQSL
jgi:hypothetical protein